MQPEKGRGPEFGLFEFDLSSYESASLGSEEVRTRHLPADIITVASGDIGDKALQLVQKSETLRSIGFLTPARTVLADGFFNGFFERNKLGQSLSTVEPGEAAVQQIMRGSFTQGEFRSLVELCRRFGANTPLAIRSSAAGDARGTGTYETVFVENTISATRAAIQKVLASYFTPQAHAFRTDAGTGHGFGVIIEPVIGNAHEFCFAPLLSGYGYTSTSRGERYINAVPGLGGGVQSRDGERITEASWQDAGADSLGTYLYLELRQSLLGGAPKRRSALLKTDRNASSFSNDFHGLSFIPSDVHCEAGLHHGVLGFSAEYSNALHSLDLTGLFSMLGEMEKAFGKPQYFEWALSVVDGKPQYWITQIADVNLNLDVLDFADLGHILFEAHSVVGSGAHAADTVVYCQSSDEISALEAFNQDHQGYVLLFNSSLTSSIQHGRRLQYHHANNARVYIEVQNAQHSGDAQAHLAGQMDMTGKVFGVLDSAGRASLDWNTFYNQAELRSSGLHVLHAPIHVLASERQNRMVLSVLE